MYFGQGDAEEFSGLAGHRHDRQLEAL